MRIKKKNVARLASLSALGAGALGVAAGTAQAGIIHPAFTPVTIGPDGQSRMYINLPGTYHTSGGAGPFLPRFRFSNWNWTSPTASGSSSAHNVTVKGFGAQIMHSTYSFFLSVVGAGQKWGSPSSSGSWAFIAGRGSSNFSGPWQRGNHSFPTTSNPNQYALFNFQSSGSTLYGWIQLSNAVSPISGPDVTLYGYAYDDSGAQIAAGDTGASTGTPEPSTLALTGLAALALGASGLRRWRGARKPAA